MYLAVLKPKNTTYAQVSTFWPILSSYDASVQHSISSVIKENGGFSMSSLMSLKILRGTEAGAVGVEHLRFDQNIKQTLE